MGGGGFEADKGCQSSGSFREEVMNGRIFSNISNSSVKLHIDL